MHDWGVGLVPGCVGDEDMETISMGDVTLTMSRTRAIKATRRDSPTPRGDTIPPDPTPNRFILPPQATTRNKCTHFTCTLAKGRKFACLPLPHRWARWLLVLTATSTTTRSNTPPCASARTPAACSSPPTATR